MATVMCSLENENMPMHIEVTEQIFRKSHTHVWNEFQKLRTFISLIQDKLGSQMAFTSLPTKGIEFVATGIQAVFAGYLGYVLAKKSKMEFATTIAAVLFTGLMPCAVFLRRLIIERQQQNKDFGDILVLEARINYNVKALFRKIDLMEGGSNFM